MSETAKYVLVPTLAAAAAAVEALKPRISDIEAREVVDVPSKQNPVHSLQEGEPSAHGS